MSWYPIGRPIGTTTYPGMQQLARMKFIRKDLLDLLDNITSMICLNSMEIGGGAE